MTRIALHVAALALTGAVAFAGGCSGDAEPASSRQSAPASARAGTIGVTADGTTLAWSDFAGKFVWVDYSAPWCAPCRMQAPILAQVEKKLGDDVVFLTVLTSDNNPTQPPTRKNARDWAKRYKLPERHVLAGSGAGIRVLPTHVLMSPAGKSLFRREGVLYEQQIRGVIETAVERWNAANPAR